MGIRESTNVNYTKSIHELREMALDNDVDIEELLRKAYLVAIVTKRKDIEEWILNEQNGYESVDSVPDYRYLKGEMRAYNQGEWRCMEFSKKEDIEMFSKMPFTESISSIVEAYKKCSDGIVSCSVANEFTQYFNKIGSFVTTYNFFVSTGQLKQIVSSIQNKIFQWTVELEEDGWIIKENIIDNDEIYEKESYGLKKVDIFLSYCWADSNEANKIYDFFKCKQDIELHRDTIDIKKWGSIKEYMQSVENMDYIILLISDSYLKSVNCMYEVLEVMRDRNYRNKIFPAVIYADIYNPITRAKYVKYWQDEFNELEQTLKELNTQNLGKLHEDLKQRQDISSNIADFLDVVSDMNNPNIEDVCLRIEEWLLEQGLLDNNQIKSDNGLFASFGIQKTKFNSEPTDLEINQFVRDSFNRVVKLLNQLCQQYQNENSWVQIQIEQIDARTVIYQFYKNGQLMRKFKLFLGSMFGSKRENIGLSDDIMLRSNGNSWNGMYDVNYIDGELKWFATLSLFNNHTAMETEEIVADIWKNYVQIHLER